MTVDSDIRMIEQVTRMGDLYDLYGTLLTARQQAMVELYYLDDWSLSEIGTHFEVSRQAVHDNLHRSAQQLEAYESALSLLAAVHSNRKLLAELRVAWEGIRDGVTQRDREKMQQAVDRFAAAWPAESLASADKFADDKHTAKAPGTADDKRTAKTPETAKESTDDKFTDKEFTDDK